MCYLTMTAAPEVELLEANGTESERNATTDSAMVERVGRLVESEARPLTEPIPPADSVRSFFDTSEVVLPVRARASLSPRRESRKAGLCYADHYWITYPGSNRICSYDLEPAFNPITSKRCPLIIRHGQRG